MNNYLKLKKFKDLNLNDPFFDSLKEDYEGFESWFRRKGEKEAYVIEDNGIQGFLYLKIEHGIVDDVSPSIEADKILKVGTFKVNPHGTRLGERFIKKALDHAIDQHVDISYVTIFKKHKALVDLLKKYGFLKNGVKNTINGEELVLLKKFNYLDNDILIDYPQILLEETDKYLLAIYPEYHTKMFPDSILNNEHFDILDDISHTNSIHKIYVCSMPVDVLKRGDIVVIYRTSDGQEPAEYRSVATSLCVIEEVRSKETFDNFDDFYNYANTYSIFDRKNLNYWYRRNNCYTIRMTYNAALRKRLIRKKLADEVGLNRSERWSILRLSEEQFNLILEKGDVDESLIVD